MRLFDVEHQWPAQRQLQHALAGGRVPHAYVFAGPEGVGKGMLAQRFARLLLCEAPTTAAPPTDAGAPARAAWREACGRCDDCRMSDADSHPDYHAVHRRLNRLHPDPLVRGRKALEIGIDVIRHFLIGPIAQRPARGRAKVYVVSEAHLLSTAAQNALLKTLEEPPGASYLILAANSAERLLPTTRSRCQIVMFGLLPGEYVASKLSAERGLNADDARYLAELTEGRLGLSLRHARVGLAARRAEVLAAMRGLSRDPLAFGKTMKDLADALAKGADAPVDEAGEAAAGEGADESEPQTDVARTAQKTALSLAACLMRDVLRVAAGAAPAAHPASTARELGELAQRFGRAGAARAIRAVSAAEAALDQNANVGLIFDSLGIEIGRSLGSRVFASAASGASCDARR